MTEQTRFDGPRAIVDKLPVLAGCVTEGDPDAWAVFSTYLLGRRWAPGPLVTWLLTNPSTAGAFVSDQTVIVGSEFSRRNGYGGMIYANLKAYIETHAHELEKAIRDGVDVVGPMNDAAINAALLLSMGRLIVAWGTHGAVLGLDQLYLRRLRARGFEPLCLGTTKDGFPKHPLRLAYQTPLVRLAEAVR